MFSLVLHLQDLVDPGVRVSSLESTFTGVFINVAFKEVREGMISHRDAEGVVMCSDRPAAAE